MSMNVIIVAVIALVVLVVLVIMLTNKTKLFSTATTNCAARNGVCKVSCDSSELVQLGISCEEGKKCCTPFANSS